MWSAINGRIAAANVYPVERAVPQDVGEAAGGHGHRGDRREGRRLPRPKPAPRRPRRRAFLAEAEKGKSSERQVAGRRAAGDARRGQGALQRVRAAPTAPGSTAATWRSRRRDPARAWDHRRALARGRTQPAPRFVLRLQRQVLEGGRIGPEDAGDAIDARRIAAGQQLRRRDAGGSGLARIVRDAGRGSPRGCPPPPRAATGAA